MHKNEVRLQHLKNSCWWQFSSLLHVENKINNDSRFGLPMLETNLELYSKNLVFDLMKMNIEDAMLNSHENIFVSNS